MAKIACFLALLKGLRSHNTCNQGNKYHWRIEGGQGGLAPPPPKIG